MKFFFTALFLFVLQIFHAQEENDTYANGVFEFEENKVQKIFTDWTRIRQSPNVDSSVLDSLQANQEVVILKKENSVLKLGERSANWYKISYQKNGKTSEGYLWGGNLCIGYRNKNGYDFLFGLAKTLNKKNPGFEGSIQQNYASVKVLEGSILLDEISFETGSGESLNYGNFVTESNHKLKNVELTLKATVSGEACGIPSYEQYILFTNKKLVSLPQLMNVGDADVYYHSEEFIFPNDKAGIPNAFIFKMEEMEKDDNDREKKKHASAIYLWNGSSYRKK
ncbi:SH3 domain-containing protein [Chryseobacterium cheonjiense]|uniref:SH3 domain-containing protein n=1 Tax=Chryseobacterium cheonjiense TaxID=2728845 RepID=A0A7Y0FKD1_9FLAO|nr:SH3 domain-containing protein [Chryseobacterium cheonjiense]NML59230.1 SH3 domain-containing protein [Chryseobacterium cheonjiense]